MTMRWKIMILLTLIALELTTRAHHEALLADGGARHDATAVRHPSIGRDTARHSPALEVPEAQPRSLQIINTTTTTIIIIIIIIIITASIVILSTLPLSLLLSTRWQRQ
jgi:hypothetical protein